MVPAMIRRNLAKIRSSPKHVYLRGILEVYLPGTWYILYCDMTAHGRQITSHIT